LRSILGLWAAVPAVVLAVSALAIEAKFAVEWLGGVFDRTDPPSAGLML
jgi:hypothetical protein